MLKNQSPMWLEVGDNLHPQRLVPWLSYQSPKSFIPLEFASYHVGPMVWSLQSPHFWWLMATMVTTTTKTRHKGNTRKNNAQSQRDKQQELGQSTILPCYGEVCASYEHWGEYPTCITFDLPIWHLSSPFDTKPNQWAQGVVSFFLFNLP